MKPDGTLQHAPVNVPGHVMTEEESNSAKVRKCFWNCNFSYEA